MSLVNESVREKFKLETILLLETMPRLCWIISSEALWNMKRQSLPVKIIQIREKLCKCFFLKMLNLSNENGK